MFHQQNLFVRLEIAHKSKPVLQPYLTRRRSTLPLPVMALLSSELRESALRGPVQHVFDTTRSTPHKLCEQPAQLKHAQCDEFGTGRSFSFSSTLKATSTAWAASDSVM